MASTNMKAVITLTADAGGVQAGVERALSSIGKLQSAVGHIRGLMAVGLLENMIRKGVDYALGELNRLKDLGSTFSPEGMAASADLMIAQQQSDIRLGQAFGEFAALVDRIAAAGLVEITDYLIANKDKIGEAMVNIATLGQAIAAIAADALVTGSEALNAVFDMFDLAASGDWAGLWDYIVNPIIDTADQLMTRVSPYIDMLVDAMRSLWEAVSNPIGSAFDAVTSGVSDMLGVSTGIVQIDQQQTAAGSGISEVGQIHDLLRQRLGGN
mgnify:CR=1 FL=1